MAINHQSILKVFNTEDVRQKIFTLKMKYNKPPIYLQIYLPLKYILYIASCSDREQERKKEEERKKQGNKYLFIGCCSQVGVMREMGYWWRDYDSERHNELVKCKLNDDRIIYLYGNKGSNFSNKKMYKFPLDFYNHIKKNYRGVVKALKIMRIFKYYYENKIIKLINDYIKKKKKQNKQPCPYCNKIMNKSSINRHIKKIHNLM